MLQPPSASLFFVEVWTYYDVLTTALHGFIVRVDRFRVNTTKPCRFRRFHFFFTTTFSHGSHGSLPWLAWLAGSHCILPPFFKTRHPWGAVFSLADTALSPMTYRISTHFLLDGGYSKREKFSMLLIVTLKISFKTSYKSMNYRKHGF